MAADGRYKGRSYLAANRKPVGAAEGCEAFSVPFAAFGSSYSNH